MLTTRSILHLDLDSFFVSVERLKNTALNGKPVIVGGAANRGVVASCSYEARKFGVHSAMPIGKARQLCPDAIIIQGDMESYSKYSSIVTAIIEQNVPLYEKTSIDEFYADLTGMDKFFGCYKWSTELRIKIRKETGLPISFGLAVNKLISKMSTAEAKPDGQIHILPGTERNYIAPMNVAKIPMVGDKTANILYSMGIQTIYQLREYPIRQSQGRLGEHAKSLWQKANAIDDSPVESHAEQKSMSTERTFMEDTIDIKRVKERLVSMTEELAFDLRKLEKITGCVTIKIRYADFNTYTKQKQITLTASDNNLIRIVGELFESLYDGKQLIRLIGIRFSNLINGSPQINIFEDTAESVNLYHAVDAIKKKYGTDLLKRAAGL
jgi:DNA polymerase-4